MGPGPSWVVLGPERLTARRGAAGCRGGGRACTRNGLGNGVQACERRQVERAPACPSVHTVMPTSAHLRTWRPARGTWAACRGCRWALGRHVGRSPPHAGTCARVRAGAAGVRPCEAAPRAHPPPAPAALPLLARSAPRHCTCLMLAACGSLVSYAGLYSCGPGLRSESVGSFVLGAMVSGGCPGRVVSLEGPGLYAPVQGSRSKAGGVRVHAGARVGAGRQAGGRAGAQACGWRRGAQALLRPHLALASCPMAPGSPSSCQT